MKIYTVGVDMGGHKVNIGLFKKGLLVKTITFPTPSDRRVAIEKIFRAIESFNIKDSLKGIGFGVPGLIERNVIIGLTNLKGWENVHLGSLVRRRFGKIDFELLNDADAAVIAEQNYWKKKSIICITLGTGLGSGVILDGKLLQGVELGHICISFEGYKCSCGARGCMEEYVSTRAIKRMALKEFNKDLNPLEVENLARKGNRKAKEIYYHTGRYLGVGLRSITNIFQPDIIVIAGGMSNAYDLFIKGINESMKKALYKTQIVKTRLNANSGVIGAALVVEHPF